MNDRDTLTMSVPEAGRRYFELSRNAAYAAAKRVTFLLLKSADYCAFRSGQWNANWMPQQIHCTCSRKHERPWKASAFLWLTLRPLDHLGGDPPGASFSTPNSGDAGGLPGAFTPRRTFRSEIVLFCSRGATF